MKETVYSDAIRKGIIVESADLVIIGTKPTEEEEDDSEINPTLYLSTA